MRYHLLLSLFAKMRCFQEKRSLYTIFVFNHNRLLPYLFSLGKNAVKKLIFSDETIVVDCAVNNRHGVCLLIDCG